MRKLLLVLTLCVLLCVSVEAGSDPPVDLIPNEFTLYFPYLGEEGDVAGIMLTTEDADMAGEPPWPSCFKVAFYDTDGDIITTLMDCGASLLYLPAILRDYHATHVVVYSDVPVYGVANILRGDLSSYCYEGKTWQDVHYLPMVFYGYHELTSRLVIVNALNETTVVTVEYYWREDPGKRWETNSAAYCLRGHEQLVLDADGHDGTGWVRVTSSGKMAVMSLFDRRGYVSAW